MCSYKRVLRSGTLSGTKESAKRALRSIVGAKEPSFAAFDAAYSAGDYRAAVNEIEQTLAAFPSSAWAHYKHALVLSRTGQLDRAIVSLDRAQALDREADDLSAKISKVRASTLEKKIVAEARVSRSFGTNSILYRELGVDRSAKRGLYTLYPDWLKIETLGRISKPGEAVLVELLASAGRIGDHKSTLGALAKLKQIRPLKYPELLAGGCASALLGSEDFGEWLAAINRKRKSLKKGGWLEADLLDAVGAHQKALEVYESTGFASSSRAKSWSFASDLARRVGDDHRALTYALGAAYFDPAISRLIKAARFAELSCEFEIASEQYKMVLDAQPTNKEALVGAALSSIRLGGSSRDSFLLLRPLWQRFDDAGIFDPDPMLVADAEPENVPPDEPLAQASRERLSSYFGYTHWTLSLQTLTSQGAYSEAVSYMWRVAFKMESFEPEVFDGLGYALALNGDYEGAVRAIAARRLIPSPAETEVAESSVRSKKVFRYLELKELLPLVPDTYLWESHFGRRIDCNPYALYKESSATSGTQAIHVWVAEHGTEVPDVVREDPHVVITKRESFGYWLALAVAKHVTNNASFPFEFMTRKGQIYVNTWHGTPLKFLGRDDRASVYDYGNVARNLLHTSLMAMPNDHTVCVMTERYNVDHLLRKPIPTGSPRNDSLIRPNARELDLVRNTLGIGATPSKILLYAPTWRGDSITQTFDVGSLIEDLGVLSDIPGVTVIFRPHPLVAELLRGVPLPATVAPESISTYDLMAVADVLVTDYSSLGTDYLATGRQVVFYVPDWDEYKNDRGLYLAREEFPGLVALDREDLRRKVREVLDGDTAKFAKVFSKSAPYVRYEDGNASQRVLEIMQSFDDEGVATDEHSAEPPEKRRHMLIHHPLMRMEALSDFMAFADTVDSEQWVITLVLDSEEFRIDPTLGEAADLIPDHVRVLPRKGAFLTAADEALALRSMYRGQDLSPGNRAKLREAFQRESKRLFADSSFEVAIEWGSDSVLWTGLIAEGVDADRRILVHPSREALSVGGPSQFWRSFDTVVAPSQHGARALAESGRLHPDASVVVSQRVAPVDRQAVTPVVRDVGPERVAYYEGPLSRDFDITVIENVFGAHTPSSAEGWRFAVRGAGPRAAQLAELSDRVSVDYDLDDWPFAAAAPLGSVYLEPLSGGSLGAGAVHALSRGVPVVTLMRPEVEDLGGMDPMITVVRPEDVRTALDGCAGLDRNAASYVRDERGCSLSAVLGEEPQ